MDELIRFGFSIEEIKNMMDTNILINNIDDNNINNLINLLEKNGCNNDIIKNIFICNPFFLSRNIQDVEELIDKLKGIGIYSLDVLFDTNPFILNLYSEDIDKIYNNCLDNGLSVEDYINFNIII